MAYITPPRSGQHIGALADVTSFYNNTNSSRSYVKTTITPLALFAKLAPVNKSTCFVSYPEERIHQLLTTSRSTNSIVRVATVVKMEASKDMSTTTPSDSVPRASKESNADRQSLNTAGHLVQGGTAIMLDEGNHIASASDNSQGQGTSDAHRVSNVTLGSGAIATFPDGSVRAYSSVESLYNNAAEIADDDDRRAHLYGTGATLRRAKIADEVIGGSSSDETVPRESRLQPTGKLRYTDDYHDFLGKNRLSINKPLPAEPSRAPPPPPGVSPHPPRVSSLANLTGSTPPSKNIGNTTASSRVERLSRPTASSAARTAGPKRNFLRRKPAVEASATAAGTSTGVLPKSSTVASVTRGLKERFSSMVKSRRTVRTTRGIPYESTMPATPLKEPTSTNQADKAAMGSPLLTTYRNSRMNVSDATLADTKGPFTGELTDKMERDSVRAERESAQTYDTDAHVAHTVNAGLAPLGLAANFGSSGDDGDDPNYPRNVMEGGPLGHYGAVEETNNGDEHAVVDHLLRTAQASLDEVLAAASTINDEEIRGMMGRIARLLGLAIVAVRDAQAATISLEDAVRNLAGLVNRYAGDASRATSG